MTTQHKPGFAASGLSDEAVAYYLETHPDFFERHSALLTSMSLSHLNSGSAVSLIERQVDLLRERNHKLERKLTDFVETARGNDVLAEKIHRMGLGMLRANSLENCLAAVETSLREDFASDQSILIIIDDDNPALQSLAQQGRFLKVTRIDSPELKGFDSLFESGRPRCGQVRDSLRDFMFGHGTDEIGSAALIPLYDQHPIGILAVGSLDARHFHPGMSTEFLSRLGALLSMALQRQLGGP
ncbi:MAG: DUF484 family protein [Gammaproteobacteria bacterium]|nr:DUF484 family protein [Gammaproteobacteria bacterium]